MKAILIKALSAFFVMLVCYFGMAWVINHISISGKRAACWINPQFQRKGGQEYRLVEDWKKAGAMDVLIFGSSHAYRGYDPREFEKEGYTMFTLGSGFQNTLASYVLMQNEFVPEKNQLIIIDVFDKTFEGDGVGCYTRWIQNAGYDQTAWELARLQPDLRTINSMTCRMFSKNTPVEVPDEEGYLYNGYCPKFDSLTTEPAGPDTTKIEFNETFADYLDALLQAIQKNGNKVVLVSHPQPNTPKFAGFHRAFRNFIDPVISKHAVIYLDYNSDHDLESTIHFADANHLNQSGVTVFNTLLIQDLKRLALLPTK